MNTEALFIFIILLLSLVLCSFLGGNCQGIEGFEDNKIVSKKGKQIEYSGASTPSFIPGDNYNHVTESMTTLQNGATYTGPDGGTALVKTNSDGTQSIDVVLPNGENIVLTPKPSERKDTFTKETETQVTNASEGYINYNNYYEEKVTKTTYYGANGVKAVVVKGPNGEYLIKITKNGNTYIYAPNNNIFSKPNNYNTDYKKYDNHYHAKYDNHYHAKYDNQYHTKYDNKFQKNYDDKFQKNYEYGIPKSLIPPGKEDLYILKSQVVPPVCPACPACPSFTDITEKVESCPPCKPCGRCPEPSFECKKVPNYNIIGNDELPIPVLNDFSTFGM